MREIIFDTETTGLDSREDRVIELGGVELVNRFPTGRTFHKFINPQGRAIHAEAQAVHDWIALLRPNFALWYHQPWGVTLAPCNRTGRIARTYARLSGLPAERDCDHYTPGSAISWQHHRTGTGAFVVELPGRDLHGREVRRHARAVAALTRKLR